MRTVAAEESAQCDKLAANPYESPRSVNDHLDCQINTVARLFRLLGTIGMTYSIPMALGALILFVYGLIHLEGSIIAAFLMFAVHAGVFFASRDYLRFAASPPDSEDWIKRARVRSWLMMLGFPIFSIGLIVLPVLIVVAVLCLYYLRRFERTLQAGIVPALRY